MIENGKVIGQQLDPKIDRIDLARLMRDTAGARNAADIDKSTLYGAISQGMGFAAPVAGAERSRTKPFTVKPIKNGYLLLVNSEEIFCVDLEAIGAQVVALMAAHTME